MDDGGYGDGASEFAGGGFMPAPSTPSNAGIGGGGGSSFSPSAGGRKVPVVLYPFTVRHFLQSYSRAGGDPLAVNGQEIANVVLVGQVGSLDSRTTDITFLLDDGTGKLEIRKWHDDQEHETEALAAIKTGVYVKVQGVPRKIGSKQAVSANSIRPITDFNEYTCHFLDCIFAYQYSAAKGGGRIHPGQAPGGVTSPQRPMGGAPPNGTAPPYLGTAGPHHTGGVSVGGPGAGAGAGGAAGFGAGAGVGTPGDSQMPLHSRVLKFIGDLENQSPAGVHRDTVARGIPGVSPHQVLEVIDFLVQEGHLYSTIDEVHYRTLGENQ